MAGETVVKVTASVVERYLSHLDMSGGDSACHLWTASVYTATGYGVFHPAKGKQGTAHRYAYAAFVGAIPAGFEVDHECHNRDPQCRGGRTCPHRPCANWRHLRAVSPQANNNASPVARLKRTRCPRDHEYTVANTRLQQGPRGARRSCVQCSRDRDRRRSPGPRVPRPIDAARVSALYNAGAGATRIRAELGVSQARIYAVMEQLGLARRPAGRVPRSKGY